MRKQVLRGENNMYHYFLKKKKLGLYVCLLFIAILLTIVITSHKAVASELIQITFDTVDTTGTHVDGVVSQESGISWTSTPYSVNLQTVFRWFARSKGILYREFVYGNITSGKTYWIYPKNWNDSLLDGTDDVTVQVTDSPNGETRVNFVIEPFGDTIFDTVNQEGVHLDGSVDFSQGGGPGWTPTPYAAKDWSAFYRIFASSRGILYRETWYSDQGYYHITKGKTYWLYPKNWNDSCLDGMDDATVEVTDSPNGETRVNFVIEPFGDTIFDTVNQYGVHVNGLVDFSNGGGPSWTPTPYAAKEWSAIYRVFASSSGILYRETWYSDQGYYHITKGKTYWLYPKNWNDTYLNGMDYVAVNVTDSPNGETRVYFIIPTANSAPYANAGGDMTISTEQVSATTIQGTATDTDGNTLQYRWKKGTNVLQDWTPAGTNGECPLNLSALSLGIGAHTLTLEVNDDQAISSDEMILTVNNSAPHANAGVNITISSEQIITTTILGTSTDFDGDTFQCRWLEGSNVLKDWMPAGANGACPLNLSALSLGTHTLTLEVNDTHATSSDEMILTIDNSAPHAAPGGGGVYEINTAVMLPGDISDYDGDFLHYEWSEGTNVICSGGIQAIATGTPVILPDCVVSNLALGTHTISLQVSDGLNIPDKKDVTVEVIDTTVPTLSPVANKYILWPPNHQIVDIVIATYATDNSGLPVALIATVASNEPQNGLGDGDIGPDWSQPVIDQNTGMITLQLRAERSGRGSGRTYTITITATDISGNTSASTVNITVPHDMAKKK